MFAAAALSLLLAFFLLPVSSIVIHPGPPRPSFPFYGFRITNQTTSSATARASGFAVRPLPFFRIANQTTTAAIGFGPSTIPYVNLSTFRAPVWTTLPISQLEAQGPFCENEADPDEHVGNHCVCKNGATIEIIPFTGGNMSNYQPCAYTTVNGTAATDPGAGLTTTTVRTSTVTTSTVRVTASGGRVVKMRLPRETQGMVNRRARKSGDGF